MHRTRKKHSNHSAKAWKYFALFWKPFSFKPVQRSFYNSTILHFSPPKLEYFEMNFSIWWERKLALNFKYDGLLHTFTRVTWKFALPRKQKRKISAERKWIQISPRGVDFNSTALFCKSKWQKKNPLKKVNIWRKNFFSSHYLRAMPPRL